MCSLIISLSYFWDEVSHWTWSSSISGCCLSSRPQGPPRVEFYTCGKDLNGGPHAGTHSRLSLTNQSSSLRKVFSVFILLTLNQEKVMSDSALEFYVILNSSYLPAYHIKWTCPVGSYRMRCVIYTYTSTFSYQSVWNMEYYRVYFICIYTTKLYLCKIVLKLY